MIGLSAAMVFAEILNDSGKSDNEMDTLFTSVLTLINSPTYAVTEAKCSGAILNEFSISVPSSRLAGIN